MIEIFVPIEIVEALDDYDPIKIKNKLEWWLQDLHELRDNVLLEVSEVVRRKNLAEMEIYKLVQFEK